MPRISRSALVMYSAEQMYDLVSDIESYAEFLPGCSGAHIDRCHGDELDATLDIGKGALSYRFSTRNKMTPGQSIEMRLLKGPFSRLFGVWTFQPLGEGSKVSLELEFEMNNRLTEATLGRLLGQMLGAMVDAFSNRAKQIYG